MRIHSKYFDAEFRKLYNIDSIIAKDGYVYCEIQRGMHGLKQAAILAYNQLKENLEKHGYRPIPNTNGLWKHDTRKITFTLCVDGFGVKYFKKEDAQHLIDTLKLYYPISLDWAGKNYCGLTLEWNYEQGYVDVNIPNYADNALKNSNILHRRDHNMLHTSGTNQHMGRKHNLHHLQITLPDSMQKDKNIFNQMSALSCTMEELLTQPFYQL